MTETIPKSKVFLAAEWRHLAMLNFEIDPSLLLPHVPAGTELDLWKNKTLVSIVGFMFLNTRVKGWAIPFHGRFEEVNLRYYIRRNHEGVERRAVSFIKEIVPRRAIAFIARRLYNENYVSLPMRHARHVSTNNETTVSYDWHFNGRWNGLSVQARGDAVCPPPGSEAAFITEHYWGYAAQPDGGCKEYRVEHAPWRVWQVDQSTLDIDVAALYGPAFVNALSAEPCSAFLAEGSAITVSEGVKIC